MWEADACNLCNFMRWNNVAWIGSTNEISTLPQLFLLTFSRYYHHHEYKTRCGVTYQGVKELLLQPPGIPVWEVLRKYMKGK